MKKYLSSLFIFLFLLVGYVEAQEVYNPLFRFRVGDENAAEMASLIEPGQQSGNHRYADESTILEYHFDLSQYSEISSDKIYLRTFLWNEYLIKFSDIAITDVSQGEQVAIYSQNPDVDGVHSGENQGWITIPLQDYIDFGWTDLYVSIFDGHPSDGWGPSVTDMGIYVKQDLSEILDNNVNAVLGELDFITVDDGLTDEWPEENEWISIAKDGEGIVTVGQIDDNADLSASATIGFDKDNLYLAANVTDDDVVMDGDKIVFYVGLYSLQENTPNFGHTALPGLTGYRKQREPDYRVEILINDSAPTILETKIVNGLLPDAVVGVTKTSTGYSVEAKIPYFSFYVADTVKKAFKMGPTNFPDIYNVDNVEIPIIPFAFQVEDFDGSAVDGALITGIDENVDDNPSSWGLKTEITDLRAAVDAEETPKGLLKIISVGTEDEPYIVEGYTGSGNSGSHRWADNSDTLGYRFNLTDLESLAPGVDLYLDFHTWNEFVVDVSGSVSGEKTNVAMWSSKDEPATTGENETDVEISVAQMRELGFEDVYVWFTDGLPAAGWGPGINTIRVYYLGDYNSVELLSWTPGTSVDNGDSEYLILDDGSQGGDSHRYVDGTTSFAYKFNLTELQGLKPTDHATELFFNMWGRNEFVITSAADENVSREEQDTVKIWSEIGEPLHDGSNYGQISMSLQPYIDAGLTSVVFFFYDGITADGWGGDYWGASITYRELLAYYPVLDFVPGRAGTAEVDFIVSGHEGTGFDDNHRWADNTSDITYHFNKADLLGRTGGADNILFQVGLVNEYVISVTQNLDSAATQVHTWSAIGEPHHDGQNYEVKDISLKEYFDQGWEDVYIVFTDGISTDGWGPSLYSVGLSSLKPVVTDVEDVNVNIPTEFTLSQNYPNPFNPSTTINYTIPTTGNVTLRIYDMLGREVITLVNDVQSSGKYTYTWRGENNFGRKVTSGVYFYRVSYNNAQQLIRKMVLLK
ncbi:MAG: T9SS type A sorting domain-containing protein [Melioribacteraceae bacterium]|nr:T9SS type A sorting domain-containing protein [Melioribacteraceae bacterium]